MRSATSALDPIQSIPTDTMPNNSRICVTSVASIDDMANNKEAVAEAVLIAERTTVPTISRTHRVVTRTSRSAEVRATAPVDTNDDERRDGQPDADDADAYVNDDGSSRSLRATTLTTTTTTTPPGRCRPVTDRPSSNRENRTCTHNVYRAPSSLCSCRSSTCESDPPISSFSLSFFQHSRASTS